MSCPRCNVTPGDQCLALTGSVRLRSHSERVAAATALIRETGGRGLPPVDPQTLSPQAQARRAEYASGNARHHAAARPAARLDPHGRMVINAADAVSRLSPPPMLLPGMAVEQELPRRALPSLRPGQRPDPQKGLRPPPCQPPTPPTKLAVTFAAAVLTVEMIPTPLWGVSLNQELSAARWTRMRRDALCAAGGVCEVCGGTGSDRRDLECHEQWAYDDTLCVQRLVRLVALCWACHLSKTPGRAEWLASTHPDRHANLPEVVAAQLARINGWDRTVTAAYIDWSSRVQEARSQHRWTQDLADYSKFGFGERVGSQEVTCTSCFTVVPRSTVAGAGRCESC